MTFYRFCRRGDNWYLTLFKERPEAPSPGFLEGEGVDDRDGLAAEDVPGSIADHPLGRLRPQVRFNRIAGGGELRFPHPEAVGVGDQHVDEVMIHEGKGEL